MAHKDGINLDAVGMTVKNYLHNSAHQATFLRTLDLYFGVTATPDRVGKYISLGALKDALAILQAEASFSGEDEEPDESAALLALLRNLDLEEKPKSMFIQSFTEPYKDCRYPAEWIIQSRQDDAEGSKLALGW